VVDYICTEPGAEYCNFRIENIAIVANDQDQRMLYLGLGLTQHRGGLIDALSDCGKAD
jgi:hypothetical protein